MTDTIWAAIIGFIGVIIGAVLTAGFTWFIEYLRAKREEKLYLKRKREEAYLSALEVFFDTMNILDGEKWTQNIKSASAKIALYLPDNDVKEYTDIVALIRSGNVPDDSRMEKFASHCKRKLGIKD